MITCGSVCVYGGGEGGGGEGTCVLQIVVAWPLTMRPRKDGALGGRGGHVDVMQLTLISSRVHLSAKLNE